jgi:hypothetical protein
MTATYDFTIDQGITFAKTFYWKVREDPLDDDSPLIPINMTGMTAHMAIRTRDGLPIAEPLCTVNGSEGEIVVGLPHTVTGALDFDTAIHDLDVWQDGVPIKRLLVGQVTLQKDVPDV